MSNIYITEPQTEGKVVVRTTLGDLDVELWAKQAPKACRNFIQLCLEGYYDNTVFHRVIKKFIAQGGDPTGTGQGGESSYGQPFEDEFHQRLRFTHRGLLAMAGSKGTNGSQFFITLDETPELRGKHTIFGKVTGDSKYNILKFNDLQMDENDRPEFPPKILGTDVLWNPFDDIVPRMKPKAVQEPKPAPKLKKACAKKNMNLLSFGDEAQEDEEADVTAATSLPKMKSSHGGKEYSAHGPSGKEEDELADSGTDEEETKHSAASSLKDKIREREASTEEQLKNFQEKMRRSIQKKAVHKQQQQTRKRQRSDEESEEESEDESYVEQQRAKYLKPKRYKSKKERQESTLSRLDAFTASLRKTKEEAEKQNQEEEEDEDEDFAMDHNLKTTSWMKHKLKFVGPKLDLHSDDGYVVYDPLQGSSAKQVKAIKRASATAQIKRFEQF